MPFPKLLPGLLSAGSSCTPILLHRTLCLKNVPKRSGFALSLLLTISRHRNSRSSCPLFSARPAQWLPIPSPSSPVEVHSVHRDRIGELRERLTLIQRESDRDCSRLRAAAWAAHRYCDPRRGSDRAGGATDRSSRSGYPPHPLLSTMRRPCWTSRSPVGASGDAAHSSGFLTHRPEPPETIPGAVLIGRPLAPGIRHVWYQARLVSASIGASFSNC